MQIRDDAKEGGFPGSSPQESSPLNSRRQGGLAVVFIGINDVWWRNTAADVFENALRDLAAAAKANRTRLVLATLTVHGELPDGKNSDNAKIEQYAKITRKVARESGARWWTSAGRTSPIFRTTTPSSASTGHCTSCPACSPTTASIPAAKASPSWPI